MPRMTRIGHRPCSTTSRGGPCFSLLLIFALCFAGTAPAQVGTLDPLFGTDGVVTTDLDEVDVAYDVRGRLDGRILVVGRSDDSSPSNRDAVVVRYAADGSVEATLTHSHEPFGCSAPEDLRALTPERGGGFVAAGYAQFGCSGAHQRDFWLLRLAADGSEVLRFERPVFWNDYDIAIDVATQADDKIVAAGFATEVTGDAASRDFAIARYLEDGTLDADGFGTGGEVVVDFVGDYDQARAVAVQPDGKIVAAGFGVDLGQRDIALARLLPDGSLDSGFGVGGTVLTDRAGFTDQARALEILPDGRLLVAGGGESAEDAPRDAVVLRYQADGTLDSTFGNGGIQVVDFGPGSASATDMLVEPSGRIVVAGYAESGAGGPQTRDFVVARLEADGSPDESFGDGGIQTTGIVAGQEDVALGLALQPADGNLVVAGHTADASGPEEVNDLAVVRLVGDSAPLIFLDGFESGDVGAWGGS